jgi:hypothetical protein
MGSDPVWVTWEPEGAQEASLQFRAGGSAGVDKPIDKRPRKSGEK